MSCTGQAHCFSRAPSLLPSSLPAVQPAESLWSEKLEDDQKMSPFLERRRETERALRKNRAERGVLAGSPCPTLTRLPAPHSRITLTHPHAPPTSPDSGRRKERKRACSPYPGRLKDTEPRKPTWKQGRPPRRQKPPPQRGLSFIYAFTSPGIRASSLIPSLPFLPPLCHNNFKI